MDKEALINQVGKIIEDACKERSLELVYFIHRYEGRDLLLRILVDKPEGGISIGECALFNRDIAALLDIQNIIPEGYILEVSSPGLDRELKSERDFARSLNKKIKFFLSELIAGKLEWDGVIKKVEAGIIYIDTGEALIRIPWDKINKAKQIF